MVPESFAVLLVAFAPCFTPATYQTFCHLVAGWLQCPGRHTVTGVAMAAGAGVVGWRHISAFHRFFGRARWEPDAIGKVVFTLALRLLPPGWPIVLLADDSLARKHGKAIALGSMHHDPLLSHGRKAFQLRARLGRARPLAAAALRRGRRATGYRRAGALWAVRGQQGGQP